MTRTCNQVVQIETNAVYFDPLARCASFPRTPTVIFRITAAKRPFLACSTPNPGFGVLQPTENETHGHGDVAYGQETLGSGVDAIDVGGYGVSVLAWP